MGEVKPGRSEDVQSLAVSDMTVVVSSNDSLQLIAKGELRDFPKYAEGT